MTRRSVAVAVTALVLVFIAGYRLNPLNPHQYLMLSEFHPSRFAPLDYMTAHVHHSWRIAYGPLSDMVSVERWFFFLHLLWALLLAGALVRIVVLSGGGGRAGLLVACGLLLTGFCGYHPLLGFVKSYVTPGSLASAGVLWAVAFLMERRLTAALLAGWATCWIHPAYVVTLAILVPALWPTGLRIGMRQLWSFAILFVIVFGFHLENGLRSVAGLHRIAYGIEPLSPLELLGSFHYVTYALLMTGGALTFRRAGRGRFAGVCLASLALPLLPNPMQLHRVAPFLEFFCWTGLAVVAIRDCRPRSFTVLIVVMIGLLSHREHGRPGSVVGGRVHHTAGPVIPLPDRRVLEWVRAHTDPTDVFLIPPFMTSFRAGSARKPFVDLHSRPWTERERFEWNRRLDLVFDGIDRMDVDGFYGMGRERLGRVARRSGATHVIWPEQRASTGVEGFERAWSDGRWAVFRRPESRN